MIVNKQGAITDQGPCIKTGFYDNAHSFLIILQDGTTSIIGVNAVKSNDYIRPIWPKAMFQREMSEKKN